MSTIAKKVQIPNSARFKPYYDTQQIVQNDSVLNFFPPNPNKAIARNNYVSNPFPGKEERMIVGLSFELVKHFIRDDAANGIDSSKIINAIKDAGVRFTADNDYKEMLRTGIEEHSNFAGTCFKNAVSSAYVNGAIVNARSKTAVLKAAQMHRLPDPVRIAPNQTIDLQVTFANSADFPTAQNWTDSGQGQLWLRATLYLAEVDK
jgi:hypothetical protein